MLFSVSFVLTCPFVMSSCTYQHVCVLIVLVMCHVSTAGRYEQVRNHSTPLALFAIGTSKSSNIALLGHLFRTATFCLHLGPYVSHTAHQGTHLKKTGGLFMIAHYCS